MPVNHKVANKNYYSYVYARDHGHLDFVKKADKCDDFVRGQQWDPLIEGKLRAQGKPVLTINKTLATLMALLGEQLGNRADISFKPAKNGTEFTAETLTKLYIQISNNNKLDWTESEVFADGVITSRGFYDVRVGFDDHMMGEVRIKRLNPRNVLLDPDADEYDPDSWKHIHISKWLTADDIELLYNKKDADYLREKTMSEFLYGYDSVERFHNSFGQVVVNNSPTSTDDIKDLRRSIRVIEKQYKVVRSAEHFVDVQTGDTRVVPETWDRDRIAEIIRQTGLEVIKKRVESIRWTVSADSVVLFDDWSPYDYFTVIPYFPLLRNGHTIGLIENLLSPQEQLNKISSQELHVVNTTANSGWKIRSGSLLNMDIEELEDRGAETGLVLELDDPAAAEKITPNQVPTGLDRLTYKSDEYIKEISGVSDSLRGFDRADVAAKAIQAKQAAGGVNIAKALDNLTRTRHLLATRVLDLVQKYYTEERVMQITSNDLVRRTEELAINQVQPDGSVLNDLTVGEYDVVVSTVPARDNFEQTQFQEALEMRKLGIAIPDDVLIENSQLARKGEIAERIRKAQGEGEPSPVEQQLQQLEVQLKQLEVQQAQAEAEKTKADAALSAVKARQMAQELMNGISDGGAAAADAQKTALEREKMAQDAKLRTAEMAAKIQMEREKLNSQFKQNVVLKMIEGKNQKDQQAKAKSSGGQ